MSQKKPDTRARMSSQVETINTMFKRWIGRYKETRVVLVLVYSCLELAMYPILRRSFNFFHLLNTTAFDFSTRTTII
jgi:hypothetical protein